MPLLGLVDTAVVGHLSANALAAVSVGASILTFVLWSLGFLRMGSTLFISQAAGEQTALAPIILRTLLLASLLGISLVLLRNPLIDLAIWLMNPAENIVELISEYCSYRLLAAPATLCNYVVIGILIGLQRAKETLAIVIAGNLLNIVLDFILVFSYRMGSDGVAIASAISEYFSLLLGLGILIAQYRRQPLVVWRAADLFQLDAVKELFSVNSDLLLRTMLLLFVFSFFTSMGARMGTTIVAANALLLNFILISSHFLDGFAHAGEAVIGNAAGKKSQQEFERAYYVCLLWITVGALLLAFAFAAFGNMLITLQSNVTDVVTIARQQLPWLIGFPVIAVTGYFFDAVFIGISATSAMRNSMLFSTCAVFLPCWYFTQFYGNNGLWFALCAFMLARGVSQYWWLKYRLE